MHTIWFLLNLWLVVHCQTTSSNSPTNKPRPQDWARDHRPSTKTGLLQWLIKDCTSVPSTEDCIKYKQIEYEGFDGWYNNAAHPELGAIDTPLLRRLPARYSDGTYMPYEGERPNPIELSDSVLEGPIGSMSEAGRTALLVFFGQQAVEEILDAQAPACPPEYFNIKVPEYHRYREKPGHSELPLLRTRYDMRTGSSPNNPRQQLNEITPWIDGGLMYGTSKAWSDALRIDEHMHFNPNGSLASASDFDDGLFPARNKIRLPMANPPPPANHSQFVNHSETARVQRFFVLGNPRGNENAFLLSFGVLWFRWHNHIAKYLKDHNPHWSGERVFLEARKWTIATQQHVTVNNWLPSWLGEPLPGYKGYNPALDPQIEQLFQTSAMRFGHTLVTPGIYIRNYARDGCDPIPFPLVKNKEGRGHSAGIRTCNVFWRPQDPITHPHTGGGVVDIDRLLMGMASQRCEKEDNIIVEDLRGNVFGPLEFSRRDLMAINIQRARDHGIPDYNTVRKSFGLDPINTFDDFKDINNCTQSDDYAQVIRNLSEIYKNKTDDIDLWIGGILETCGGPGPTFRAIIMDQFQRIRDADRFWFENERNGFFSKQEVERIKELTIYDVIMSVTNMEWNDIQPDPFRIPNTTNSVNERCHGQFHNSTCFERDIKTGSKGDEFSCSHLPQLGSDAILEECSEAGKYDYFTGSELSFILTFLLLGLALVFIVALLWFKQRTKQMKSAAQSENRLNKSFRNLHPNEMIVPYAASEWVNKKEGYRPVVLLLVKRKKLVEVRTQRGELLRTIEMSHYKQEERGVPLELVVVSDDLHFAVRVPKEYDLILRFETTFLRENFISALESFITECECQRQRRNMNLASTLTNAITKSSRQKSLERFFRVVFAQAFKISHSETEMISVDSGEAKEVINTELTKAEFADALSMHSGSLFVEKMFNLVDKDKNGYVSFREFLDMLVIFAKGTPEDKAKLMFEMYDINNTGKLNRDDFTDMIRTLMESSHEEIDPQQVSAVVDSMFKAMGGGPGERSYMTLEQFQKLLLKGFKDEIKLARLNFVGTAIPKELALNKPAQRGTFIDNARSTFFSIYETKESLLGKSTSLPRQHVRPLPEPTVDIKEKQYPKKERPKFVRTILHLAENCRLQIFWATLYTLVLIAIFAERAYYYSVEREHTGLRRIAGYGVTITRGAASSMMFAYSTLLITMCRNLITKLRDTFLHNYIPFDSAVSMHKYIAVWALFFTVIHTVGHAINFYHISTQTPSDLSCLFRNFFRPTHVLPKFHYWCWQTITGFTGIVLVLLCGIIYTFATQYARRHLYNWFWATHNLYPIFYIFMILHGSGKLVQIPIFHLFFLGPCILFAIDRLISISRKKVEIIVTRATLLPSGVTCLQFKRPSNFEYKSGQWVRIACVELNGNEYHPFTLSSAPHELQLSLHIRAVGPWTSNIRQVYAREDPLPKIYLDGPYGEGHQDWYKFEVAVLIGGGIGVTPFASILKDIVFRSKNKLSFACKKVYFLWVTRTQKHFEWLVDIIREVEDNDENKVVSVHIFITQFYHKFDLRTILLYICERHFQKLCDRSLLTGLRSITHFGRPNFTSLFTSLKCIHQDVGRIGVFSCGPPPLTHNVDESCSAMNRERGAIFQHHSENF